MQYMQYMLIQAHTCMRQSRSGGVFGGLWQTLYVSGSDETSPIGWDGAWDRVDKLGSGLASYPAVRGGRFRDLLRGRRGGCAKSGCQRGQGWRKKVFEPMTWGALSEARRVPPQETVIRGRCGDSCACRCNRSQYNMNSYNTDIYIR
jgi:hypothetical protein